MMPTTATEARPFLSPAETAAMLSVSRYTVYRLIRSGQLPSVRVGGQIRLPRRTLAQRLAETRGGLATAGKDLAVSPTDLLAQRHRDYEKAPDRHLRALEQWRIAQERIQALEREVAEAAKSVAASRRGRREAGYTAPDSDDEGGVRAVFYCPVCAARENFAPPAQVIRLSL
jgi:excisionase family DNA binding protein